jgi:hypothetical protein
MFITQTVRMWLQIDYISKKEMQELQCKTLLILGNRDIVKPEDAPVNKRQSALHITKHNAFNVCGKALSH